MFISKKKYMNLCKRIDALDDALASVSAAQVRQRQLDAGAHAAIRRDMSSALKKCADVNDITDVLFGFSQDMDEIRGKISDLQETISDDSGAYMAGRRFLEGIGGISLYDQSTGVKRNGE